MVLHKSIIKNCFMWVACNHLTFCNENPTIVYNITFSSSPHKPMSSHYISICPSHTMAIHYVIIPMCIPLVIVLFILFKIFFTTNLFITFRNIFFTSSFMESNSDSPTYLSTSSSKI